MIESIKLQFALWYAQWQLRKMRAEAKAKFKPKFNDKNVKFNEVRAREMLSLKDQIRWDELKRFEYSVKTKDQALGKDVTRNKTVSQWGNGGKDWTKYPRSVLNGNPTYEDIKYATEKAPTDRPLLKELPKKEKPPAGTFQMWSKTLPNGQVVRISDSEYQELRKASGLDPMPANQYKDEIANK